MAMMAMLAGLLARMPLVLAMLVLAPALPSPLALGTPMALRMLAGLLAHMPLALAMLALAPALRLPLALGMPMALGMLEGLMAHMQLAPAMLAVLALWISRATATEKAKTHTYRRCHPTPKAKTHTCHPTPTTTTTTTTSKTIASDDERNEFAQDRRRSVRPGLVHSSEQTRSSWRAEHSFYF